MTLAPDCAKQAYALEAKAKMQDEIRDLNMSGMRWINVILPGIFLGVGLGWFFAITPIPLLLGTLTIVAIGSLGKWLSVNLKEM